jgi:predicted ATPase/DNA-binding CsgD family transcriptional regulator
MHGAGSNTSPPLQPDPGREPVPLAPLLPDRSVADLPLTLTPLVGREREVATVSELLQRGDVRLVVLTGPGGVGKTRVALQVSAEARAAFPDGVAFVQLASIRDPGLVLPTIAQAFGLRDTGTQPLRERLTAFLRAKQLLLVLDNFEQVLPAAPVIPDLLATCPGLRVMVTSRAVLRVSGEHDIRIPPLQLPAPSRVPLATDVAAAEAVRLFVDRAIAARDDFVLTDANAADVVAICHRVDGLPLALELAAARVAHLPPAALRARLDQQPALLAGGPRDQPARLQSMRDAIAWSYNLLPVDEQALFRRLAVFVGGCTPEAAQAVCESDLGVDILEGLASLVDTSLLRQEEGPGGEPRFGMLETIREYGLEQLAANGEGDTARHAHANYFLAFAETADEGLLRPHPTHELWRDRLAAERDNIRAALGWLVDQGEAERSQRLAGALGHFWFLFSNFREGAEWLERTLALPHPAAMGPRALALRWAGVLTLYRLDAPRAAIHLDESLALFRALGDTYGIALVLVGVGLVGIHQGDYERAIALHEEALGLVQTLGDALPGPPFLATVCLHNLGAAAYGLGEHASAAAYFEEALARVRDLGHSSLALVALAGLGNVARDQGDYVRSAELYREGLEQSWTRGNKRITAYTLAGLGSIAGAHDQPELATRLFGAAEALLEVIGVPLMPAFRAGHERAVAAVRAALPATAFTEAWEAGRALSLKEAVAAARAVANLPHSSAAATVPAAGMNLGLTPREREVLRLLVEGRSDKEIAEVLSISSRTVGGHVTHLLTKLGVETRTAAATYAVRHGLA